MAQPLCLSVLRASVLSEEGLGTWFFLTSSSGCPKGPLVPHLPTRRPSGSTPSYQWKLDTWWLHFCSQPISEGIFPGVDRFSDNSEEPSTSSSPALGAWHSWAATSQRILCPLQDEGNKENPRPFQFVVSKAQLSVPGVPKRHSRKCIEFPIVSSPSQPVSGSLWAMITL